MNVKALASNLEMEEEEFLDLMKLFLEASVSDLTALQSALQKKEVLKVAMAAHSIRGAAANLGLTEIVELAGGIEAEARKNRLHRTQEWTQTLRERLDQVAENLGVSRQGVSGSK
jgi:histidine phosphotransfer protein HptB